MFRDAKTELIAIVILVGVVVAVSVVVITWIYGSISSYMGSVKHVVFSDPVLIVYRDNNSVVFNVSVRNMGSVNVSFVKIFVKDLPSCLSTELNEVFNGRSFLSPGEESRISVIFRDCVLEPGVMYTVVILSSSGEFYYVNAYAEERK
ncbi:MAG: hypothetical protein ACP5GI_04975 [Sulfolobales archaeon]